jgi:hypothetical protein
MVAATTIKDSMIDAYYCTCSSLMDQLGRREVPQPPAYTTGIYRPMLWSNQVYEASPAL